MALQPKTKSNIANFFGGIGYFLCALQWLFVILLYSPYIEQLLKSVLPAGSVQPVKPAPMPLHVASSAPLLILAAIITIGFVLLSLYVLIKTPKTIVKTTQRVVQETAEVVAPVVMNVRHIHETPKSRKKFVLRVTIVLKCILVLVPLILSFCSQYADKHSLDFSIVLFLSIWLAVLASFLFILQYALALLFSVHKSQIR